MTKKYFKNTVNRLAIYHWYEEKLKFNALNTQLNVSTDLFIQREYFFTKAKEIYDKTLAILIA